MPLYLTEKDVEALLTPGEAVPRPRGVLPAAGGGRGHGHARERLPFEGGSPCWPPLTPVWACPG